MRHVNHARPLSTPVLLGRTRKGTPVWSIAGGAGGADDDTDGAQDDDEGGDDGESDDDGDTDDADAGSDDDGGDDEPLGEAGEKALRAMKKRARDAERELRRLRAAKQEDDSGSDEENDPEKIREKVREELQADVSRDRALDKLEAKAARKFQNPELARKLLAEQADDFLDEKGNPDVEAINEALDELLEEEPYLAVQSGKRFEGKADGGARNGSKSAQLTRDDLAGMSPEQITKAKNAGQLDTLLGRT